MRSRPARFVAAALERKGFDREESHHTYFHFRIEGRDVGVSTRISHGVKELSQSVLGEMKKQLKFATSRDFERFVECPMTAEEYLDHLKAQGAVD